MFRLIGVIAAVLFLITLWAATFVVGELWKRRVKRKAEERIEKIQDSEPKEHRLLMSIPWTDETHPGPFWKCPDPRCNREGRWDADGTNTTDGETGGKSTGTGSSGS